MTAEIVHLTSDVTRQKALLEAFNAAVNILDSLDANALRNLNNYKNYQSIEKLISDMTCRIPSSDELRIQFNDCVMATMFQMIPDFEFTDLDNAQEVQDVIDIRKIDLLKKFRTLAVQHGLLQDMFKDPRIKIEVSHASP